MSELNLIGQGVGIRGRLKTEKAFNFKQTDVRLWLKNSDKVN